MRSLVNCRGIKPSLLLAIDKALMNSRLIPHCSMTLETIYSIISCIFKAPLLECFRCEMLSASRLGVFFQQCISISEHLISKPGKNVKTVTRRATKKILNLMRLLRLLRLM